MGLDDEIYKLRREKLKQIEALGQVRYRTKYEFTHTVEQILAQYIGEDRRGTGTPGSACVWRGASWRFA